MSANYHRTVGSPLLSGVKSVNLGSHKKLFFPNYDMALKEAVRVTEELRFPIWIHKVHQARDVGYFISGHGSHTLAEPDSPLSTRQLDQIQFKVGLPTLMESTKIEPSATARLAYRHGTYLQCHSRVTEGDIVSWCMMQEDPALIINVLPDVGKTGGKKICNHIKNLLQEALFCQTATRWINRYNIAVAIRWPDDMGASPKLKLENGWWHLSAQQKRAQGIKPGCIDLQAQSKAGLI